GCFAVRKRYCRGPVRVRRGTWPGAVRSWRFHSRAPLASDRTRPGFPGLLMPGKVRIALDAMGGDVGAPVVIPGASIALARHRDTEFVLVGDRAKIEPELAKYPALQAASRIVHTDVAVSMEDKPSQALRRGRRPSSMWLAIDAVKKGEADVAVSAGNTG